MMELPALCRKLDEFLTGELDRGSFDADKAIANTMSYNWVYELLEYPGSTWQAKGKAGKLAQCFFLQKPQIFVVALSYNYQKIGILQVYIDH